MNYYKIKSKLLNFFSNIRIYPGGIIIAGDSHYDFKGKHMRQALDNLKTGDVLLRRYSHYLGSVLIKGYFSHAAIFVGGNNVIHMLGEGIVREDILTFMRCDDMCILRVANEGLAKQAVLNAHKHESTGVEYDYDFDISSPSRLYCTEFVDNCFGYPIKKEKSCSGFILPDNFLESSQFKLIWRKE